MPTIVPAHINQCVKGNYQWMFAEFKNKCIRVEVEEKEYRNDKAVNRPLEEGKNSSGSRKINVDFQCPLRL